jgi:hypothetical protein
MLFPQNSAIVRVSVRVGVRRLQSQVAVRML